MTIRLPRRLRCPSPASIALAASVGGTLLLGLVPPVAAQAESPYPLRSEEAVARVSDEERERIVALRERILQTAAVPDEAAMEEMIFYWNNSAVGEARRSR